MTAILDTNAPDIRGADGNFAGYGIPDSDPVTVETKWVRKWDRDDELVYVTRWADGTWAEWSVLPSKWNSIANAAHAAKHAAAMAAIDAQMAKDPLKTLRGEAA